MRTVVRWVLPAAVIAALIGLWQIAASAGWIAEALSLEPFLVPSPAEVGDALWNDRSLLLENTWVTLREILLGILLGFAVGIALATAMRFSRLLRDAVFPLTVAPPGGAGGGAGADPGDLVRLRRLAEDDHRRPRLLLPDRRQHAGGLPRASIPRRPR